jgi:hypothetical protein
MGNIVSIASSSSAKGTPPDHPEWYGRSLLGRYEELCSIREPFLERARAASKLTIPSLLPPQGHSGVSRLYKPWQSIGARGVNSLSAKLLLALLPTNTPFFRYVFSQLALKNLSKDEKLKTEYDEGLSMYEKEIMAEIESGTVRISSFEAMQHLIVAGNGLLYVPSAGGMKFYKLDTYVVVRDGMGNVLEIITQERLSRQTVPEEMRTEVDAECRDHEKSVLLHTCVKREDNRYRTWQEIKGIKVPGSEGNYPLDASPFIPLRWQKIDGEDYGRGHIEMLQGDLGSVEGLSQSIVEGSAAAAKMLILVKPNGNTKLKTVAEAPNGGIRTGDAADVTVVQSQKAIDLRVAKETRAEIKADLEASLLMASSIQRNGERVTATEIRMLANELESALGGVYATLAQEFQLPLVARIMAQLVKSGRLKKLPKGIVKPTIVTGLEALSRGNDLQRLDLLVEGVKEFGPEAIQQYLDLSDLFTRRATALGINHKGLIRGADEVAKMQQAAQQQALLQSVAPQATKALGDMANKEPANAEAGNAE